MFGDRKKAAEVFHLATEYQVAPFLLSKEYRPFLDGNYLMNQASLLMAAMYGFTGLRISEGDWRTHPVSLPEGWTRIEIQRIWIHGKPFHLVAEQGKTAVFTPIPDGP
jgi:trehalose/maltose hydrolase-like predicted phosphorylase